MIARLTYEVRMRRLKPRRYRNLLRSVHEGKYRRILEIGVFDGLHAEQMIQTARIHHPPARIEYLGFDLFESLTDADLVHEASKRPPTEATVRARLEATGAVIDLRVGYTHDTLPAYVSGRGPGDPPFDFIFIDGGHSFETIASDWAGVQPLLGPGTTVIFDDYYENRPDEIGKTGCQKLIGELSRDLYSIQLLEPVDRFRKDWGTLNVRMVEVTLR